jgi:hypothetical protein
MYWKDTIPVGQKDREHGIDVQASNGNDFLPSGAGTSATTKFQAPTIWSLRLVAGCAAAAMVHNFIVSSPAIST